MLKRWGKTGEVIEILEKQKEIYGEEEIQRIDMEIEKATRFEAKMDEWMDKYLTIKEAKICLMRYWKGMGWSDIYIELGMSKGIVSRIHKNIINMIACTWEG